MSLPLGDLRVIDLTVARAGPQCVRQLADWGADVIRVEAPVDGGGLGLGDGRLGSDFQNLHRNKRAITLDLKQPEGLELLMRLVDTADVLVENMRPPVKDRLGFGWAAVHARNPRLVYASISGFGQDGPYAERGGVDQIVQGMGGLMSITGLPGTEPTRVGVPISDLTAGLQLAIGVLVALHERERTGVGRWVQTSLLESMIAMLDLQASRWTMDGVVPRQEGNHHPTMIPMGCFRSSDGWVNVAGPSGRLLHRFCEVIGMAWIPTDPRFDSAARRSANRADLNELIAARLAERTTAEWVQALNDAGVPCGPVNTIDATFADPQVQHLGMAAPVQHPTLGEVRIVRNAVTLRDEQGRNDVPTVRTPTPGLDEHTDEVLRSLGLDDEQLEALRARKVI